MSQTFFSTEDEDLHEEGDQKVDERSDDWNNAQGQIDVDREPSANVPVEEWFHEPPPNGQSHRLSYGPVAPLEYVEEVLDVHEEHVALESEAECKLQWKTDDPDETDARDGPIEVPNGPGVVVVTEGNQVLVNEWFLCKWIIRSINVF